MKKTILGAVLSLILLVEVFASVISANTINDKELTVAFTHDLHSYIDTREYKDGNKIRQSGGFAKIATVFEEIKSKNPNTVIVDGGDFSMGTLFQTVYAQEAVELRMLGLLGYDAITLGNHEFDYASRGLADMLNSAIDSGDPLPAMVISNIDWDNSLENDAQYLRESMDDYGVSDYTIIQKNDVKIAVFGGLGIDGIDCAPNSGLKFNSFVDKAKEIVAKIEKEESADIIICLSHSGTSDNPKASEDEILAKQVPQIDIIVSGHTHSTLEEPITIGNTSIFSSGEYGQNIGKVDLEQKDDGRWSIKNYDHISVNEEVEENQEISQKIEEYRDYVNDFLANYGYDDYLQEIAYSPYNFSNIRDMDRDHIDQSLGNLISDSLVYGVKQAEKENYIPVDVSIVPVGMVRATFKEGPIKISDAFEVMSLGIGADGTIGYPLGSVYLTGKELKTVAEVDASITQIMSGTQLYCTGLQYTFNPNRTILNRATDISLVDEDGQIVKIDNNKLYRVVSDVYSAQMLGAVMQKSKGILAIVPKDASGKPVEDFNDVIIYDSEGAEVKEWYALASYLQSFDEVDGLPTIPADYEKAQNRKLLDDSKNIVDLLRSPNKIFMTMIAIIVLIIAAVAALYTMIKKKRVKRTRRILS